MAESCCADSELLNAAISKAKVKLPAAGQVKKGAAVQLITNKNVAKMSQLRKLVHVAERGEAEDEDKSKMPNKRTRQSAKPTLQFNVEEEAQFTREPAFSFNLKAGKNIS